MIRQRMEQPGQDLSRLTSTHLYNLSRPEREAMEKYITALLATGLIHLSSSPVAAGFFFVSKKDKSLCPCDYFIGLDNITMRNKYQLPLISSAFESLEGATMFTTHDLPNGYNLVRIKEGDEWKMVFNTPSSLEISPSTSPMSARSCSTCWKTSCM